VSIRSDRDDQLIAQSLSGTTATLTRGQIREVTGLTEARIRASLTRLRESGSVTTTQNMRTKAVHHFLASRSAEAMAELFPMEVVTP
jgi:hypothetical protein